MRGVDTNLLLRYFTADDPQQSPLARSFVADAESRGEALYINVIVLCELAWNLQRKRFGFSFAQIATVIEHLLDSTVFEVQSRDLVRAALRETVAGGADFADYLLGEINQRAGCRDTVTFDIALGEHPRFTLLTGAEEAPVRARRYTLHEP